MNLERAWPAKVNLRVCAAQDLGDRAKSPDPPPTAANEGPGQEAPDSKRHEQLTPQTPGDHFPAV